MNIFKDLFNRPKKVPKVDVTKRFDLITRTGQGSMSQVWKARDSRTGQIVALKVLDKAKTDRLNARFPGLNRPSEGEVAISLHHPFIVRTFEFGLTTKGEEFLVMEFLEGVGLSFLVEMQNQTLLDHRLRLVIELGEAIAYLHQQNWIHRDLCPRNILLDEKKHIKLIDFGLVVPNTPDFQKPGNRTGTAYYMAPELIRRQRTDQRIDIFSYAVTCYEMYTKTFPWDTVGGMTLDAVTQRINTPPRDIRKMVPDIDEKVAATIMKGLENDPGARWQTMKEMVYAFRVARQALEGVPASEDPSRIEEDGM